MSQAQMAAGIAKAFLDYAVGQGAPRKGLLQSAGLSEDDLIDQDARVPVAAYYAMIGAGIELTGDTSLLLRHVLETKLETMSIVGQIMYASRSFPHSLEQLNRYGRLIADVQIPNGREAYELCQHGSEVWLIDNSSAQDGWLAVEASFARFISEFRRSAPEYPFGLALEVSYPPPPHAALYPELLQIPVTFEADRDALQIDPLWLEIAYNEGTDYVFGVFTKHADGLLEELAKTDTVRAAVETMMMPGLHEGTLSMDQIARDMGMSRQTLYRRLKDEGVTFAQVHDDLRRRMAMDYLSSRRVSVGEAAYLLGFSEASAFVRAFKRWTGSSPTQWLATA